MKYWRTEMPCKSCAGGRERGSTVVAGDEHESILHLPTAFRYSRSAASTQHKRSSAARRSNAVGILRNLAAPPRILNNGLEEFVFTSDDRPYGYSGLGDEPTPPQFVVPRRGRDNIDTSNGYPVAGQKICGPDVTDAILDAMLNILVTMMLNPAAPTGNSMADVRARARYFRRLAGLVGNGDGPLGTIKAQGKVGGKNCPKNCDKHVMFCRFCVLFNVPGNVAYGFIMQLLGSNPGFTQAASGVAQAAESLTELVRRLVQRDPNFSPLPPLFDSREATNSIAAGIAAGASEDGAAAMSGLLQFIDANHRMSAMWDSGFDSALHSTLVQQMFDGKEAFWYFALSAVCRALRKAIKDKKIKSSSCSPCAE